jgi:hypothetical protein
MGLLLTIGILLVLVTCYTVIYTSCKSRNAIRKQIENFDVSTDHPAVYCIMVTGKDACRQEFALAAIENFKEQSYPNKYMIILNHGTRSITVPSKDNAHILHIQIEKARNTLGELRNIALQMVPFNAFWCTWDDDDYRHPDFIAILMGELLKGQNHVVAMQNRIEYNALTALKWKIRVRSGLVHILAKKDPRVTYLHKDTMEDIDLIKDYIKYGHKVHFLDNDPTIYIRLVHHTNTSMYVNNNKRQLQQSHDGSNYGEFLLDPQEERLLNKIISEYYKPRIKCIAFKD